MTKGTSVAAYGKSLIDTPYKEVDCIKLVVLSVRNGAGADGESKSYQCGGCNELWRSLNASGKYRYVTRRLELETAKTLGLLVPGALLVIWEPGYNEKYKDNEGDCSHIGIYVGDDDCEVVHSSATKKCVAASTIKNGWTHVLIHRLIDLENGEDEAQDKAFTSIEPYEVIVSTNKDPLTVRLKPSADSEALGKVKKGGGMTVVGEVEVDDTGRAWLPVEAKCDNRRSIVRGWAAAEYLAPVKEETASAVPAASSGSLDNVIVPRETVLALADAVNVLHGAATYNAADYLNGVNALIGAAQAVTAYLKGDD